MRLFAPPLPRLCTKKSLWRDLWFIQNEVISLVAVCSKELWLVEKNRATVIPDSSDTRASLLAEWKLTAKAELNYEIYKSWRKCRKIKSVFVMGTALWAEKLGRCLENYRSWENTLGKLVATVNVEAIWFEFWMKGAQMTVEIFVFCGWWFSNQFDIVSETHFSCDTVDRGLWSAILSSLLCSETCWNGQEHSHRKARLCILF